MILSMIKNLLFPEDETQKGKDFLAEHERKWKERMTKEDRELIDYMDRAIANAKNEIINKL